MIPPLLFMGYMLYGIPLLLLYILIVVQLLKKSNQKYFSSSFFVLAKIQAIIDITGYINLNFQLRFPLTSLFGYLFLNISPSVFLSFSYFYRIYADYIHNILITFASLNRLTALLRPTKHEKLWNKCLWLCVGFAFVISFILSWYFLFSTILITEFTPGQNGIYTFIYTKSPIKISTAQIQLCVNILSGSIALISNLLSLAVLLRQHFRKVSTDINLRKAEISLFAVAIGDFVIMIVSSFITINLIILMVENDLNNPLFDFYFLQLPWVTDMQYLSRPVLFMFMSKNVRNTVHH